MVSDSVQPRRRQPTRLPSPWDSPGKNTGVGCHFLLQCMPVKSESEITQSCQTLSDPMDCSLPGSPIHGIFQARVLKWGATAFSKSITLGPIKIAEQVSLKTPLILSSKKWKKMKGQWLCHVWLFVIPWTIQSMEFSRPEYWSGEPLSLQRIFPTQRSNPGILHCRWIHYQLSTREAQEYLSG